MFNYFLSLRKGNSIKSISLLFLFLLSFSLIAAVKINIPSPTASGNYSSVSVNNSQYLQGLTPAQVAALTDLSGYLPISTRNNTLYYGSGNYWYYWDNSQNEGEGGLVSVSNPLTLINNSWNETRANSIYVPYTGATGNVNLGINTLNAYSVYAGSLTKNYSIVASNGLYYVLDNLAGFLRISADHNNDLISANFELSDDGYSGKAGWNFDSIVKSTNFNSTVATGTQPYATSSTTLNTNLNADLLDGLHSTQFANATWGYNQSYIQPENLTATKFLYNTNNIMGSIYNGSDIIIGNLTGL